MSKRVFKHSILFLEIVLIILLGVWVWSNTFIPVFIVQSDSMEPTLQKGDLVFIKKRPRSAVEYRGKIIVFLDRLQNKFIVHRVVGESDGFLITQGDNNNLIDFYHPSPQDILGEVFWSF